MEEIREELFAMAEPAYRDFAAGLLPGTENILGVRLPNLRKLARQIARSDGSFQADWRSFARETPFYFEEIMLQGMVLGYVKITDQAQCGEMLSYIEAFVPKIANWSVCDSFCAGLKFTKEYKEEVWHFLTPYLRSDKEYEVRFGIVMLLFYYIKDQYIAEVLGILKHIRQDAYYVKMAVAWNLSMCYIAYPEAVGEILRSQELDVFTNNKTIQKICESRQASPEQKQKLRGYKR